MGTLATQPTHDAWTTPGRPLRQAETENLHLANWKSRDGAARPRLALLVESSATRRPMEANPVAANLFQRIPSLTFASFSEPPVA